MPRRHFERAFSRDLAVFALKLAPPSIPGIPRGSILEPGTAVFSRFFHAASAPCAKRLTSQKHYKNQYETHFGASAHRPKIDQKSIRQRFRLRLATRMALRASWELSRDSWSVSGQPGDAFGQSLAALGPPGASPDRPWGGTWACKSRPEGVQTRPRNRLGRPNRPKIDFDSISGRFS